MPLPRFVSLLTTLTLALLLTVPAAAQDRPQRITIAGSDTMNLLSQRLAEEYMARGANVEISVRGGGSGVGIRAIIDGTADICQSSRAMREAEFDRARENGHNPQQHVVGLDGLAIGVSKDNPVDSLTLGQVRAIFTGAIRTWNEIDPSLPRRNIVLYGRESNSGTYDYFKEYVLEGWDFASNTNYMAATAQVANATARERYGIGFGGVTYFAYADGLKILKIQRDRESPAVSPVVEGTREINFADIQDETYPIARPLRYYTPDAPSGAIREFLDWVMSPAGQQVVMDVGYIPVLDVAELEQVVAEQPAASPGEAK